MVYKSLTVTLLLLDSFGAQLSPKSLTAIAACKPKPENGELSVEQIVGKINENLQIDVLLQELTHVH